MVKNPPASVGDIRDMGSIPVSGRSPGGGQGSPLQYSHLENPTNRRAWQLTAHEVTKSWTELKHVACMHVVILTLSLYFTITATEDKHNFPHFLIVNCKK